MKIEHVEAYYLRMPEVLDIGDGSQDALLISVDCGGVTGWGECEASPLPTIAALIAPLSHSACHPVLDSVLGMPLDSLEDIGRIHQKVKERSQDLLQTDHALSGIDMALWDNLGKRLDLPVWQLFGSSSEPKIAYASQLFGDTPSATYEAAKRVAESDFRAAKFGWGPIGKGSLEEDRDQVAAAREGLGWDRDLLVDTGCAFGHDVARASALIPVLEEFKVKWWEEPFLTGALAEYSSLAKLTSIPLAAGESCHTADQARHFVDYAGVGFIQVDCGRIGGITSARQVAGYVREKKVAYVNHTFTSNLALSASQQPYADFAACYSEVPTTISSLAIAIGGEPWQPDSNGFVYAPTGAGLGIDIDPSRFKAYEVAVEISVGGKRVWPK
ncbi:MAG TPA: mandelate racemase/muconate lactonizing enzyme family protein [Fimbriimonadaceae bacterium]|jgi:L-alanine-DL-glutamate epimerase-like enolase superfamily enzyme